MAVEAIRPQVRQPLDNGARHRRPLAHHTDDLERPETRHDRFGIGDMVVKNRDRGTSIERRPIGHRKRDLLVVVENSDFWLLPYGRHEFLQLI